MGGGAMLSEAPKSYEWESLITTEFYYIIYCSKNEIDLVGEGVEFENLESLQLLHSH